MDHANMRAANCRFALVRAETKHITWTVGLLISAAAAQAQTQIQPQSQLRPNKPQVQAPAEPAPTQNSPLTRPRPSLQTPLQVPVQPPTQPIVQANSTQTNPQNTVLMRFQTIKIDNKLVDIRTLPDSTALRGISGKTITVARIKQLQARIDGATSLPMLTLQKGQNLRSFAAAPAGTLVALPGGRVTRSQNLATIQTAFARLGEKRFVQPIPLPQRHLQATAVVGQGISLADAMRRPGADVIQIGTHKYTADQLRKMDVLLKESRVEPRGLLERMGSKTPRMGNRNRQGGIQ
jgi:hypothetical protein